MNDDKSDHGHTVALFRYGLIADLVRLEPGTKGLYAQIEQKAAVEYTIPGTTRTRVAAETIRDWIKRHRRGGFDALIFFLSCIIIAGIYGAMTAKRSILFLQTLPAAIAMALLVLSH